MRVELTVFSTDTNGRIFLNWSPVQASARLLDGPGGTQTVDVELRNAGTVGRLVMETFRTHRGQSTLRLSLPGDGSPVRFWVAGEFDAASISFGDAKLEAVHVADGSVLGSIEAMVRVRKNAQKLSAEERDRFVQAFGELNAKGTGRFSDFRTMHKDGTLAEAHGDYGFLPWHRVYLLDLERELQAINAEVTLPYWRFDMPAPDLFSRDFFGVANSDGRLEFSDDHPFNDWITDTDLGILRSPNFNVNNAPSGLRDETTTIEFGNGNFADFSILDRVVIERSGIEVNPHGRAHTSFSGWIRRPPTAPKDPLFFLLHANVDRLWAKWQWFFKRHSDQDPNSYPVGSTFRIGHNIDDTMWPWNLVVAPPRPAEAPGGTLAASPITTAPGSSPSIRAMMDYQGVHGGPQQGFDYDDVPFETVDAVV